jgi:photosynthesis system II assembly factor YCF48-like protein
MSELPKIVRQRLQQADKASVPHPEANVLTAFAESSLLPAERISVLDHLSQCAECREVLALALPAMEAGQAVLPVPRSSRLSWPTLRWAFVSAGIVALSVFGFVEYGHRDDSLKMAKNSPPPAAIHGDQSMAAPAVRDERSANEERSQPTAAVSATREKDRHESPQQTELAKDVSAPAVHGPLAHGPRQTNQFQQQNANTFQIPARAPNAPEAKQELRPPTASGGSGASQMVEVQSESAELDVPSKVTDSLVAGNKPTPEPELPSASDGEVSRAKSAPAAVAAQAAPAALETQGRTFQALHLITPAWTVNSGRLQRSLDQGQTWRDVNVVASADTGDSMELAISSDKAGKTRKDKKAISMAPVFRAVAANGADVWAGGTAAALYHSSDAGVHWARVVPTSESATLSGDILSLEFADAQNGRISTSTGEVWTTIDNGQSWKKQ